MKISVILPVYNGEKYVEQAIWSVLNQQYKDLEVLAVNDGSKDHTLGILNEIAKKDSRLRILNQKNQGVAVARNSGIRNARGEYLAFLDQDDIWVSGFLTEEIMEQIVSKEYDMVSFAYYHGNQEITRVALVERKDAIVEKPSEKIGENFRHHSSYFYRRDFLVKNNIYVDNRRRHEDERFRLTCLCKADKMLYIAKSSFVYRNNEMSVTHQKNRKVMEILEECIEGYDELLESGKCNQQLYQVCEDIKLHLLLELLCEAAMQNSARKIIETYEKKYAIKNFLNQNTDGWMSEADKNLWDLYQNNLEKFLFSGKKKKMKKAITEWGKRLEIVKRIYDKKRYPLEWRG